MLSGKFWITPNGVVDVSTSEHALYAKNAMLGLLGTPAEIRLDKTLFSPLPKEIVTAARKRRVDEAAVEHLASGIDARLFVIERWGWIRTRGNAFYLWKLDAMALRLIRCATDFWDRQSALRADDYLDVHELAADTMESRRIADVLGKRLASRFLKEVPELSGSQTAVHPWQRKPIRPRRL